jgi:putative flippase GtrA
MKTWLKLKFLSHYRQFIKYSLVGVLCFLIDISILMTLIRFTKIHYLLASAIGYLTGVIINYFFSINWIFSRRNLKKYWHIEFSIFFAIELIAMSLMSVGLFMFKDFFGLRIKLSKVLANLLAAGWNYIIKHLFLFKKHPQEKIKYLNDRKEILFGNQIKK